MTCGKLVDFIRYTTVSSANKTDCYDLSEKVMFNTYYPNL